MFRPRVRMLLSTFAVGSVLWMFPAMTLARGPGHPHWHRPPVHHHHHHGGGSSLGAFFFGAITGAVVHELLSPPRDAVVVTVRGSRYYRSGDAYYRACWRGDHWVYLPVEPPPEVIVTEVPPSPRRVIVNGQTYYRGGDTVYVEPAPAATRVVASEAPRAIETVPAPAPAAAYAGASGRSPVGSIVRQLPAGAISVRIGTTEYYAADGIYYLPVRVEGQTRYVAVDDPTRTSR